MAAETKLLEQLDGLIKHFNAQSEKHKTLHRHLRYAAIGLTGCATVLAGIAATFPEANRYFSVLLVLATAAVSVVTAVEGVRKPGELWIHERNVLHALRDMRRKLDLLQSTGERIDVMHYSSRVDRCSMPPNKRGRSRLSVDRGLVRRCSLEQAKRIPGWVELQRNPWFGKS